MPRHLAYTEDAVVDLRAIRRWLTQPGAGAAARRRLADIRLAIARLRDQPCLHAPGDHAGTRELACGSGYRVVYEVEPDTGRNESAGDVLVLRVFGPGQSRVRL